MRKLVPLLLLSGCAAEPDLPGFERARIVAFAQSCATRWDTDQCVEACSAAFPDDHSDGNQQRWLTCVTAIKPAKEASDG